MAKLTFHQGISRGDQVVTIDGEDVSSGIRSLSFKADAGEAPEVSIHPAVYEIETGISGTTEIDLSLAATRIHILPEAVDLLKRFGWTPPAEES